MKTLLILRHAKSSWKEPGRPDFDRPLNARGKRDAPRVGEWLTEHDCVPDLIVSSAARRARKTATKVAENCGYARHIELVEELYLASAEEYFATARKLDNDLAAALFVGHNPGISQWLYLCTRQEHDLPTAALAIVRFDLDDWRDLSAYDGELVALWFPRSGSQLG